MERKLRVKAAEVEVNSEALNLVAGANLIGSMFPSSVEGTSLNSEAKYLELHQEIIGTNHFLLMLQTAFQQHKPISISPDDIWLLICQGFAEHLKLHSEEFKDVFGIDEKRTIQVRRDDFTPGKWNPWEEILPEFTKKISDEISDDLHSNIILEFSTSTKKEINAFEIAFMDSMSNYFDYEFLSLCGIPEIELKGTPSDYNEMVRSLEKLKKFNLGWWIDRISNHLNQIILTLEGKNNFDFWSSIYKEDSESGGPFVTGWIADFFPYIRTSITEHKGEIDFESESISKDQILKLISVKDLKYDSYKVHKVLIKNPKLTDADKPKLTLDDFPSGLSKVPFKWNYLGKELKMNFISGFIGIKESTSNHTLRTDINWVVTRIGNDKNEKLITRCKNALKRILH